MGRVVRGGGWFSEEEVDFRGRYKRVFKIGCG